MYVKLDLLIVRGLTSKHSVALYELMKDYQNLGKYSCRVEEFRKLMGIRPEQYSIFTMFRKRVLDTAVEEINEKTDIFLDYELEKEGRRISNILLKVRAKDGRKLPHNKSDATREKLKEFNIQENKIEELIEKHDEQYLWANIAIVEEELKKGKISNVTAYLLKAFQNDYRPQETTYEKKLKEEKERLAKEEEKKQLEEQFTNQQRADFEEQKKKLVQTKLKAIDQLEVEQLKIHFIEEIQENDLFIKIYNSK